MTPLVGAAAVAVQVSPRPGLPLRPRQPLPSLPEPSAAAGCSPGDQSPPKARRPPASGADNGWRRSAEWAHTTGLLLLQTGGKFAPCPSPGPAAWDRKPVTFCTPSPNPASLSALSLSPHLTGREDAPSLALTHVFFQKPRSPHPPLTCPIAEGRTSSDRVCTCPHAARGNSARHPGALSGTPALPHTAQIQGLFLDRNCPEFAS